jgi:hypothetical protein
MNANTEANTVSLMVIGVDIQPILGGAVRGAQPTLSGRTRASASRREAAIEEVTLTGIRPRGAGHRVIVIGRLAEGRGSRMP